jgi:TonB family protein
MPPEDEFIPVSPIPPSRRKRSDRIRLGPFLVSSALVAWGASLLAHGAVAIAAVIFVRTYLRNTPPQVRFAFGGGSEGSLIAQPDSPDTAAMPDAGPASPQPALPMATPQSLAQAEDRIDTNASRALESAAYSPALSPGPDPSQQQIPFDWAAASSGDAAGPSPRLSRSGKSLALNKISAPNGQTQSALHSPGPSGSPGLAESPGSGAPGVPVGLLDRSLPAPLYPAASLRKGEQGTVKLSVEVKADGTIGQIRVIEDPGYPLLVESAIAAVRQARFSPELRDGKSVAAMVDIPFRFALR